MSDLTRPDGKAAGWDRLYEFTERMLGPGLGKPLVAAHASLHPSEDLVAATTEVRESLSGRATARVAVFSDGNAELLRPGHRPSWSPDGSRLAHLVDRGVQVDEACVALDGQPERFAWSPDSTRLLVVVAEPRSEMSNLDGSGIHPPALEADGWLPNVSSSTQHAAWRRLVVVDLTTLRATVVSRPDLNIWDATWCGTAWILAVCSDGSPTESAWYAADLRRLEVGSGDDEVVVKPDVQFGVVAASPAGTFAAYVTSDLSDRDLSAGPLQLLELASGTSRPVSLPCDVTCVEFIDEESFGFAGVRGLTTVIGTATVGGDVQVLWESERETALGASPYASFRPGRTAFVRAGYATPPEVCLLRGADLSTLVSLAHPGSAVVTESGARSEVVRWTASDGLELESWLHRPDGAGPHPLIVWVHGGPVASHRSTWPGGAPTFPYLLSRGYAVWHPNPRGSSGRGADFTSAVRGDMGGADAGDIRSGVEHLIASGVADPQRIGLMGGSYGGYMSAWLITQCGLFAAAVPMFPITDWTQQHGISSIPYWDEIFLDGRPYATDGQYRDRSPMTYVSQVRTPTLFIAGGLDRATPGGQALTMHRALLAQGVATECVTYPHEGHGTKDLSATIDSAARISDWFDRWMSPEAPSS
ncbi:MAG TPA: S9 family peptidase [Mycobacteriales bacterium]|nr:S9 family peptidase [Mycobacteriales bacterium]